MMEKEFIKMEVKKPESNIESKEKRPKYRYFFHGTLKRNLKKIEDNNSFIFSENRPNLSSAPLYGLQFIDNTVSSKRDRLKGRLRHSQEANTDDMNLDTCLLVIEPPDDYKIYSNIIGAPIETNKDITARSVWSSHQKYLAKDKNLQAGMLFGPFEDKKRELPMGSIKMVIESDQKFKKILLDFVAELNQGKVEEEKYIDKLVEYFKKGEGVLKDNIEHNDYRELARDMVLGQFEYYVVNKIRKLFLNIKHYQSKEVVLNPHKGNAFKPWSKKRIELEIDNLKKLRPRNEFFKKYLKQSLYALDKKIMSHNFSR